MIVYFYPAAMTPGCTKEACDFRDRSGDLSGAGTAVCGISPDKPEKLAKFRAKEGQAFPLLSDPDHAVQQAYGAYGEKMMYGKKSVGVIRSHVRRSTRTARSRRRTTASRPPVTLIAC